MSTPTVARRWLDDPKLELDALSPGQRYTLFITLALAVCLLAFGLPPDGPVNASSSADLLTPDTVVAEPARTALSAGEDDVTVSLPESTLPAGGFPTQPTTPPGADATTTSTTSTTTSTTSTTSTTTTTTTPGPPIPPLPLP
jgi:hypothetical protein